MGLLNLVSIFALLALALAAEPNIVTKSQWNAVESDNELRPLQLPVGRAIILHTAGADCANEDACVKQVRFIQNYHMKNYNFDDIAYNFLIGNDGNVYEGRGWSHVSAAVRNYNSNSLSIAFIGTFNLNTPTEAALNATMALLELGVSTNKLTEDYKLFGHRQLSPTESPGAALYSIIKKWPHWSRTLN